MFSIITNVIIGASGKLCNDDIESNKKMFWKEIKRVRKGEYARDEMVKDINSQILRDGVEVEGDGRSILSRS